MKTKIAIVFLILVLLGSAWGWQSYQTVLTTPVITGETKTLQITKGDSVGRIAQKLQALHIPINTFWFKWFAYQKKLTGQLKVGEYDLKVGLTLPDILRLLTQGKTHQYTITFPEGWTFKQMRKRLAQQPDLKQTLADMDDETIMARLKADNKNPEGLFFPATYFFTKNASDFSILKKAYRKMAVVLETEWAQRADNLPLQTPYEALILASIVEKETAVASERPLIAGVFTQRLKIGMLLQTDPTVIYGMGSNYQGNIHRADLRTPTPYNTYIIKGLPPTPIAMPGKAAIQAVLHPTKTDNLYFVARGDGSHVFSATLDAHNKAVNHYIRGLP